MCKEYWKGLDEKVKKMTACDVASLKTAVFFFALIVAKLWPGLLSMPYWVLITLTVVFSWKPFHAVWLKSKT